MVVCPKCRKPYTGCPALSRVDNQTDICPDCGMREAIKSIPGMGGRKNRIRKNESEGRYKPPGTDGRWKISMQHTVEVRR